MLNFRFVLLCLTVLFSAITIAQDTSFDQPVAQHPELAPKEHAMTDVGMRFERDSFHGCPARIDKAYYPKQDSVDLFTIMGVVAVFGLLAIVSAFAIFFAARRHQAKLDLVRDIVASGQPLPDSLSAILKDDSKTPLARAIQLFAFGLGLTIMLSVLAEPRVGVIGILFICIGAGQLLVHFIERKRTE